MTLYKLHDIHLSLTNASESGVHALLALKPLLVKDGYHVTCTVSSNFLLDKGHVAENLQRVSLLFY